LGVKTGKLNLAPESIEGSQIQTGSVELVQTDPFRRSVIGLAPFFVGLTALFVLSSILPNLWNNTISAYNQGILFSSLSLYYLLATLYFLFAVSTTMFASKEDMKGVIPLAIVLGMIGGALYFTGVRIGITEELTKSVTGILSAIVQSLSLVLFLNLFLYVLAAAGVWRGKNKQVIQNQ